MCQKTSIKKMKTVIPDLTAMSKKISKINKYYENKKSQQNEWFVMDSHAFFCY